MIATLLLYFGPLIPAFFIALLMKRVCMIEPVTVRKTTIAVVISVFVLEYLWLLLLGYGLTRIMHI